MISISPSLLRGQRARSILGKHLLVRVVLTYGANTYTYTTTKIKQLSRTEQIFSHKSQVLIEDTDKTLHGLDLEGYKVVQSFGLITRAGEEWVDRAPLWVVGQDRDSYRDRLECNLELEGIFDRMGKHKATDTYTPDSGDTRTVKDWLTEIISLTDSTSESTEEQTTVDSGMALDASKSAIGQKVTISDRRVTKLSLRMRKVGNPLSDIAFVIRTTFDETTLARKIWGDASSLSTSYAWIEVTFDTPVQVNEEVRIYCEFTEGDASNYVDVAYNASSVKASENLIWLNSNWTEEATYDIGYKYTYSATPLTIWGAYPAYGLVFDSEDDLIDSFIPADSFRIGLNETRLQKVKQLLRYTDCIAVPKNDGLIHIINPTTSGTTYDNEFTLVYGRDYHNFFSKRFRRRIVSPNYITFKNHPSHSDSYTGSAKDASADLTDMLERETHYVRATSDDQCTNLANALLSKYQMAAEKGAGVLPFVHFGQEIYDYTNFVDARAGDNRAGNVGNLTIFYKPGRFNMALGFGRVPLGGAALQGFLAETGSEEEREQRITAANLIPLIDTVYSYIEQIIDILGDKVDIDDLNEILLSLYEDAYFRKATVTEELNIPSEAA